MAITLQCKNGHTLRVKDDAAGKKVRCPQCQTVLVVDEDAAAADDEEDEEPVQKRKGSSAPSGKKARGKGRGKKKSGSGALVWVIAGGAGVALIAIGIVLFLVLRPAPPLTASVSQPEVQPASSSPAPVTTNAATNAPQTAATPAEPAASPPAALKRTTPKTETAPAEVAKSDAAEKPPQNQPAPAAAAPTEKDPSAALVASDEKPEQPAAGVESNVKIWDAGETAAAAGKRFAERGQSWTAVGATAAPAHNFSGDCVIENGKLWLHIPRDQADGVKIAAKESDSGESVLPITIVGAQPNAEAPRVSRVTEVSADSVTVAFGVEGGGPKVSCRVTNGKYWIEVIPQEGVEQLSIAVKAKFVVMPTEFGEDAICDADWVMQHNTTSLQLSHDNLVIALERDNNHMSLLTFPSISQAGELTIGLEGGEANRVTGQSAGALVNTISAKFDGHSIFVSLLPQKNLWYSEVVTKKYSAPGHYPITSKSLYPGMWRIAGRITGKNGPQFYVSDFPNTNLLFECRQSGTLECLFYFLSRPVEGTSSETLTPLDIYRETLAANAKDAYLLETEQTIGILFHPDTKYRGVCGCVDDMRDAWKTKPQTLATTPAYFTSQLADCKTIMNQMDMRLHDYEQMSQHLGEAIEQLEAADLAGNSAMQTFVNVAHNQNGILKNTKVVEVERAYKLLEDIEKKIETAANKKISLGMLDKQIELVRDVANKQEDQLKKYRGIYLTLSKSALAVRETAEEPLKQQVTLIGRDCRKMLRTRGRAE